jgi:hypothetical protein
MVATQNQFSLAKFQDSIGVVTTDRGTPLGKSKKARATPLEGIEGQSGQWAGPRETIFSPPVEAEVFS